MAITLVVEDGSRPEGANVYADVSDADLRLAERADGVWGQAEEEAKKAALIQAADYLNGLSWKGRKVAPREMAWPRADVVDADDIEVGLDTVPVAVAAANIEMAAYIVAGGNPKEPLERGGAISSLNVAGAVSISYFPGAQPGTVYPAVKWLLRGLLRSSACVEVGRG